MDTETKKLIEETEERIMTDINFLIRARVQDELNEILKVRSKL